MHDSGSSELAFFVDSRRDGVDVLVPLAPAASAWGEGWMRGMAVSGALARAVERRVATELEAADDFIPARWTLDLFRPASMTETTTRAHIVRQGRRLMLVESELWQKERPVARATALLLRPVAGATSQAWSPDRQIVTPPTDLVPTEEPRLFFSETEGWSTSPSQHRNNSRKGTWHLPMDVVEGEPISRFAMAASVADVANVVANWGSDGGLGYINADITLSMSRLPEGREIGLVAADRFETDGISIGSAWVADRRGVFGIAAVSCLSNPGHNVGPEKPRSYGAITEYNI